MAAVLRSFNTEKAFQAIPSKNPLYNNHENVIPKGTSETHTFRVKVVSKETIKPSTRTPHHLQTFKLSGIDQTSPPVPVSLVLFFSGSNNQLTNKNKLILLKKSLSETLTGFYPLAGRIADNKCIICTDQGVNFFQAKVTSPLNEVVTNPQADQLITLLPTDNFTGLGPKVLLSVQANFFSCGGIAIGVSISHKAVDASSISLFLNNWAASTRSMDADIVFPKFDIGSFFPSRDDVPVCAYPPGKPPQKLVAKRFLFNSSKLASLKDKCSDEMHVANPTRVEALSALIWRCAANAARIRANSPMLTTVANIIVNIRAKMSPALSNDVIGNMVFGTMAQSSRPKSSEDLAYLVGQLRKALRKVDGDYVRKLQTEDGFSEFLDAFKQIDEPYTKGELEFITITSWLRFPFYEVDFGWGTPVWACPANLPGKNTIALMDSKDRDGVEAWVSLDEPDMAAFECEPELLSFSSTVYS